MPVEPIDQIVRRLRQAKAPPHVISQHLAELAAVRARRRSKRKRLPETQVRLLCAEGLTRAEIARQIGKSPAYVSKLIRRNGW